MARLGKTLTAARERKGLSLRDVERATGLSNAYLSQIENGKIASPSPKVLHKIAILYELSYAALMSQAGYPAGESDRASDDRLRLAARLGPTSPEEEDALAEYLAFLRSRTGRTR
ncbi:helix-turn-helix transcriptional regulator [Bradyrhizobium sp. CB82]|uniref:helix-turn-helix domain-containing protein n=1 Tax=Bradyrhizobium sp. CB82 TaxID=3039159 RepID=UPI0024B0E6CE|nr:helix-turn-helix transcriptional regulator [Bradyrhizobium sp. CB82]WFU42733.1 helix-turn-helix transcriptional regulator [Bradyrhizobium sp. CB82]